MLRIIKIILILLLVVTIIGAGGYYISNHLPPALAKKGPLPLLQPIAETTGKVLASLPKNVPSSESGNILGVEVEKSSQKPQLLEKARYDYCKQVVSDYSGRYENEE